jgi:hypothetical protein
MLISIRASHISLIHPLVRVTRAWVPDELDVVFGEFKAHPLTMNSGDGCVGVIEPTGASTANSGRRLIVKHLGFFLVLDIDFVVYSSVQGIYITE